MAVARLDRRRARSARTHPRASRPRGSRRWLAPRPDELLQTLLMLGVAAVTVLVLFPLLHALAAGPYR